MRKRIGIVAIVVTLVGVAVLLGTAPRALASSTVLDIADGAVFVRHVGVESPGRDDQVLAEGDEVLTGEDGHAVILFFDGSTLALEPATSVRIDAARVEGRATLIDVYQAAGTTWHAVQRILEAGSRYEVTTPGAVAAVRGTAFQVSVGDEDDDVTTEEGTVEVMAQRQSVRVTPGLRATVRHGDRPRAPEEAPRPQRVLRLDLVGGTGAIVDRGRRAVGAAPDGSLRNAIPGARVQRDGDVVHVFVPNPTRDLRFVAGPNLRSVRYAIVDASGAIVSSGQATSGSGPVHEVFDQLRGSIPEATPAPRPRTASPTFVTPRLTALPTRTAPSTTLPSPTLLTPPPTLATPTASPTPAPTLAVPSLPAPTLARPTPTPGPTLSPLPSPTPALP